MRKINLIIDKHEEEVNVERYFQINGNSYLIYSNQEEDPSGNVKVYVVKINDHQKVEEIKSEEEWNMVKQTIIGIVNANKEFSKLPVEDLDYQLLKKLKVTAQKALRLPKNVMPFLSANQMNFSSLEPFENEMLAKKEQSLKEISADLTNLMEQVNTELGLPSTNEVEEIATSSEPIMEDSSQSLDVPGVEGKQDQVEPKMEATMEIIMPKKQEIEEAKDEKKKEKSHFSFKNFFGKKKAKEEQVSQPENPVVEESETAKNEIENSMPMASLEPLENTPVSESTGNISAENLEVPEIVSTDNDLNQSISESDPEPISVENGMFEVHQNDNINVAPAMDVTPAFDVPVESISNEANLQPLEPVTIAENAPLEVASTSDNEATTTEIVPNATNEFITELETPFQPFVSETSITEPLDPTSVLNEMRIEETPIASQVTPPSPIEVLKIDDDNEYKPLYEEQQRKNQILEAKVTELETKVAELQNIVTDYQEKLSEVKDIVG